MRKKVWISGFIILMICFVSITQVFKPNTISSETKSQIENNVTLYLLNNENFNYGIQENIDIQFDKKSEVYIVTVTFENTSKKMNLFVSKDSTILTVSMRNSPFLFKMEMDSIFFSFSSKLDIL